jgi:uncharacterized membrane protein
MDQKSANQNPIKPEDKGGRLLKDSIERIGGHLHRVVPILDKSGEVLSYALKPIMVEFKPRDVFQIVIGCSLLAVPVAYTEEAWVLADTLPDNNIIGVALLAFSFIGAFVYFNFYRGNLWPYIFEFVKRVIFTYLISFVVVALFLTLIQKCPWETDSILAIKRVVIVSFPAAMSGTLSDTIK